MTVYYHETINERCNHSEINGTKKHVLRATRERESDESERASD